MSTMQLAAMFAARKLLELGPGRSLAESGTAADCSSDEGLSGAMVAVYIIICVVLIVLAGMMAGLTLGAGPRFVKEHGVGCGWRMQPGLPTGGPLEGKTQCLVPCTLAPLLCCPWLHLRCSSSQQASPSAAAS